MRRSLTVVVLLTLVLPGMASAQAEPDATELLCVRVVMQPPTATESGADAATTDPRQDGPPGLSEMDGETLTAAVVAGTATLEIVDPASCPADATEADGSSEPGNAGEARPSGTPYSRFVARGVSAVVELAVLAEAREGAKGASEVAAAAKRLRVWSRGQRRWLQRHAPQACYEGAHRRWLRGISRVEDGARDLRRGVLDLDAAVAGRGAGQIARGTAKLAAIDLDATSRRCIEAAA